jgi:pyridoxamine 5'-phosphate oxidase
LKTQQEVENLRQLYASEDLRKSSVEQDPVKQFLKWFNQAVDAAVAEPTAMILATAGKRGIPSVRTVLLKSFDMDGFIFFTNYKSAKGNELTENPFAEVLFLWKEMERQVRISGKVGKIPKEQSEDYFKTRPYESRIGAWASQQSSVIPSREFLDEKFQEFRLKYPDNVPMPEYWGGYKLFHDKLEFWQGRKHRMHDRICYIKKDNKWEINRLAP